MMHGSRAARVQYFTDPPIRSCRGEENPTKSQKVKRFRPSSIARRLSTVRAWLSLCKAKDQEEGGLSAQGLTQRFTEGSLIQAYLFFFISLFISPPRHRIPAPLIRLNFICTLLYVPVLRTVCS
jgi:hypothetical protein